MSDAARSVFGCALRELLYDGAESVIYRGIRIVDGQPVIVKALRADYPTPTQVARYRSECVLLQRLCEHGARGIDAPLEFAAQGHRLALIFTDRGAVDLSGLIESGGLQPAERFKIASEIIEINDSPSPPDQQPVD
ncbi:MAG: hypothetical protein EXR77_12050 [Myxococcales bacterium]|nr:hypothetical protein [Myxococcales bacterium]